MQLSLSSERYHVILEACQNTLHVWIKNFPQVYSSILLSITESSTELYSLWAIAASFRSSQIQDTLNIFFFKLLQHGQNLFPSPCWLQLSFMPLQDSGRKQPPPSPAVLKACSPPPAQYQAAAYKNLWGLRVAILALKWCGFLMCNWDCVDTDLKLPLFSPWQQS